MEKLAPCKMEYAKDAFGKEILLKDGKFQVMMEWEKPYMQACIDALQPFGDVLEIGFGCGYSATHIQSYNPKSHTIIEYHPVVAEKAREWAKGYPHVIIVEDTWQNALASLGIFDAIFFDDYPLESESEMKSLEMSQQQSHALLQQGSQLIQDVEKSLPFLKQLSYSDADLEELVEHALADMNASAEQLLRFLSELQAGSQITSEQHSAVIARLQQMGKISQEAHNAPAQKKEMFQFRGPTERLLVFLQQVLNAHMRKGSRFSCFFSSSTSKFEDPKFVEEVICNPYLDYTEKKIDIEVPTNCDYYTDSNALVMTITKMSEIL